MENFLTSLPDELLSPVQLQDLGVNDGQREGGVRAGAGSSGSRYLGRGLLLLHELEKSLGQLRYLERSLANIRISEYLAEKILLSAHLQN